MLVKDVKQVELFMASVTVNWLNNFRKSPGSIYYTPRHVLNMYTICYVFLGKSTPSGKAYILPKNNYKNVHGNMFLI